MSSPRTAILKALASVYTVLGPSGLDITPHQVTIRVRTWLGGALDAPVDSGPQYTDADLVLPQVYSVRQITTEEIDGSAGEYERDAVVVEGIVPADPANPGVGFYPTQLAPVLAQGQERYYLLVGPHNGEYELGELRSYDPFAYSLVLKRRVTTPVVVTPDVVAGETE